ncbi:MULTISPECIES: tRNA 2-thiocytidine(32) synthetase TtcA [Alteromonadaceae]|uniref:tRNA-cytidine(32) 2-sulfurtransferase n=1 Tax=Brumicola blandensis TaxID=3075611 RepID=A0AAW8QY63_9ALTE|nr:MULTISPECIES: tRNA 2-thiocytidine(32) synthetase TtcA [unclassified Alteromonas]MDT0581449.1 tRNA 2-thiocytidine(32) synthetase TtcA [Alteromonas sp. W409]MDT0627067.1 tRNA 2-thiocytidine(32) synthetase TtcA [Alteromonas sp. W364]
MVQTSNLPKQKYNNDKLVKRIRRNVGKAIADYQMIEDGDVVMAAISGGKDSFVMLDILLSLQQSAPINFEVIAVNLDQKQPGFPEDILPSYLEQKNIPYYIIDKDTYSVVKSKIEDGKTTCGLCSRLRRGSLYSFAEKIGATKIALGHHMDDMVETTFLNMFYGAKLKSMPPKLLSDDKRNIVIRPLAYCREKDIASLAAIREYPIIPCNLCGSQENLQRQNVKAMLNEWDRQTPGRVENIFNATKSIIPSQLADTDLFDFKGLQIDRSSERKAYDFNSEEVSSTNIDESLVIQIANL